MQYSAAYFDDQNPNETGDGNLAERHGNPADESWWNIKYLAWQYSPTHQQRCPQRPAVLPCGWSDTVCTLRTRVTYLFTGYAAGAPVRTRDIPAENLPLARTSLPRLTIPTVPPNSPPKNPGTSLAFFVMQQKINPFIP